MVMVPASFIGSRIAHEMFSKSGNETLNTIFFGLIGGLIGGFISINIDIAATKIQCLLH